jgi:hypothetical protein
MMTKTIAPPNAFIKILATTTVFFFIVIVSSFGQDKKLNGNVINFEEGWWKPVLQKHNINLDKFNFKNTFYMGMNDTIKDLWLEMGNSDSLNNRNIPLKDAILISKGAGQTYWILTSEYAHHSLDNNIIILKNGKSACYDFIYENIMPTQTFSFQDCSIDIKKNRMKITSGNSDN